MSEEKLPPKIPTHDALRPPLPKRFYKSVSIAPHGQGYGVLLDARRMMTPAKHTFVVPAQALAAAITEEWAAQKDAIDPASMPLTRMANTAIDAVSQTMDAVANDIAAYAMSDLLCYRAATPRELALRQAAAWDPVLQWAAGGLGLHLKTVTGVVPVEQPPEVRAGVLKALCRADAFRLAGIHVMTTLTGSAVLALAVVNGHLVHENAWAAAHVDEDWQIEHWGEDFEAAERRRARMVEFAAAAKLLKLL